MRKEVVYDPVQNIKGPLSHMKFHEVAASKTL